MKHPSYRAAIQWIADNDDTEWVTDEEYFLPSVTASMVGSLFDVPDEKIRDDIRRALGLPTQRDRLRRAKGTKPKQEKE